MKKPRKRSTRRPPRSRANAQAQIGAAELNAVPPVPAGPFPELRKEYETLVKKNQRTVTQIDGNLQELRRLRDRINGEIVWLEQQFYNMGTRKDYSIGAEAVCPPKASR